MSSSILATYKLLPTFEYCDRLECYVDDVSSVSKRIPAPQAPPTKKSEVFDLTRYSDVDKRALSVSQMSRDM